MLQSALYSVGFGSIVFARHSRNRERKGGNERKKERERKTRNTYISQWGSKRARHQNCSQISLGVKLIPMLSGNSIRKDPPPLSLSSLLSFVSKRVSDIPV